MTGPHPQSKIATDNLTLRYGPLTVIPDLTMRIRQGAITSLVGRNGCGKSTLLRCLGRLLPASAGSVLLDGKSIAGFAPKELARQMAMLPQGPTAPDGMTVQDLVEKGRYPHRGALGSNTAHDRERVTWALRQTGMSDLADRPLERLSGGQRQRAWIAMALAQDTSLILLDEPTTFLDVAHQYEVMDLCADLHARGRTLVAVLHDLNQAARYATHLVVMKDGTVVAQGAPATVLTAELVESVFGMACRVVPDPVTATPLVIRESRRRRTVAPAAPAGPDPDPGRP